MSLFQRPAPRLLAVLLAVSAAAMLPALSAQGPAAGATPGQGPGRGGQRGGGRGQGPVRDLGGQPVPDGTGIIAGVVTLSGSGTPVRRVQVTLSTAGRGGRNSVTDEEGRFSFVALPAGRFTLTASKPGFASVAYGAKKPGRQGTPIQLADGQAITNANISLARGGVITGVVVDEYGEPAPNTQVRAYRYVFQNGERTLQQAGQNQTDDRGLYRIFQLLPGEYVVSAVPRNNVVVEFGTQIQAQIQPLLDQLQAPGAGATVVFSGAGGAFDGGRGQAVLDQIQQLRQQLAQQPEQSTAYAPVYYPGTTTPAQAGRIPLDAGQERTGVDFQLQLVPTARVQGRVTGPDTTIAPGAQVMLQPARQRDTLDVPGLSRSMTRLAPDGAFTFQSVTPGDYRLMVRVPVRQTDPAGDQNAQVNPAGQGRGGRGFGGRGGPGSITQVLWASTDVSVNGRDVSDLTLSLQPGLSISGRIAFDASGSQPPSDLSNARIMLIPTDGDAIGGVAPQTADAGGNFTLAGVAPGHYTLRATLGGLGRGGPFGGGGQTAGGGTWTLKSALVNGRDVLDFGLEVDPNASLSGVVLTFSDRMQEVSGMLQDAMGRPAPEYTIIMFAADNQFWVPQSRRILSTRPGTDGSFAFRGFPAGQYRLTAVTDAEPGEWFDPAFLTQVVPASVVVAVGDGEKKVQDLRLAGQ